MATEGDGKADEKPRTKAAAERYKDRAAARRRAADGGEQQQVTAVLPPTDQHPILSSCGSEYTVLPTDVQQRPRGRREEEESTSEEECKLRRTSDCF